MSDQPSSERSVGPTASPDTILLHVLSPSPEVNGGRITFPSIPLDTDILHLKSRIQNSMTVPMPLERQRLIYRGRPVLNMHTTLRQILQSEASLLLQILIIQPVLFIWSSRPRLAPHQQLPLQLHIAVTTSPYGSSQPLGFQSQPHPTAPPPPPHHHHHHRQQHQHHPHHPQAPTAGNPMATHAHAAEVMLQNQLNQLQQQVAMTNLMGQGHGQGHGPGETSGHGPNLPPHLASLHPTHPSVQAFHAAVRQRQQMRAQAGMQGVNGASSGMAFGQNAPRPFGPITTRVHETVGPDGQRTRVVVNETTFQISRQSTPVPGADRSDASPDIEPQSQTPGNGPTNPSQPGLQSHQQQPFHMPFFPFHADGSDVLRSSMPPMPTYIPQAPAWQPLGVQPGVLSQTQGIASAAATAWLLSGPGGPQALVFSPGHGLFANALPTSQSSIRPLRPRTGLRFQQTPTSGTRPQHLANVPNSLSSGNVVPDARPPQAPEPVARAENPVIPARQPPAEEMGNNEDLRSIVSRIWTFIKLYFVIFMFTESRTWYRWICIAIAVLVSAMPSTTVFREFTARLQAQVDGLVPPPPPPQQQQQQPAPHQPARQQIDRPDVDGAVPENENAHPTHSGEAAPDPASTAARLVQEHRQRHPSALQDSFEWAQRAVGLFLASLIPGVGERHIRAREDARRELERVERERLAREEQTRRAEQEKQLHQQEEAKAEAVQVQVQEKHDEILAQDVAESSTIGRSEEPPRQLPKLK